MSDNENQKVKTFNDLVGGAIAQQKQAVITEYKKKADDWAKRKREAQKISDSLDAERVRLEEDFIDELSRF